MRNWPRHSILDNWRKHGTPTQCSQCRETPAGTWGHCWSRGVRAAELGQESDCRHLKGHRQGVVDEPVPPACSQVSGQRHSLGRASWPLREILRVSLDRLHWFGTRTGTALAQNPTNKKHQKELGPVMESLAIRMKEKQP